MNRILAYSLLLILMGIGTGVHSQEYLVPLSHAERSAIRAKVSDTSAVELPFFDDFSDYEGTPKQALWSEGDAFVNKDYGRNPPTIGMVTLDALKSNGELHAGASTNLFSGDTLLSRKVRLDSITKGFRKKITPSDSVYLSFFYQPSGGNGNMWERLGNAPDQDDSIFLEFYNPQSKIWKVVWSMGGLSLDSLISQTGHEWDFVNIPITESAYFHKDFRFRFRNYCSMDNNPKTGINGNTDMWNIDYVYLNYNRRINDRFFRDVAFVNKATTLLKDYSAMPYSQFRASNMASNLNITITNLYSQALTSHYQYKVFDETGNMVHSYDGGYENAPSFPNSRQYQSNAAHSNPPVNYVFPSMSKAKKFSVMHVVKEGTSGDGHPGNDTTIFEQVFDNYFAYDDGIPENGYGLTSTSSKLLLGYMFTLNSTDTLTAVDIYFNKTLSNENENIYFNLCVWRNDNGTPGQLLYKDENRYRVGFKGLNKYVRFKLSCPLIIEDTVFIGFEQQGNDYINIGFDRNNNTAEKIFYRTSSSWQQSILAGSLMLRPYFGAKALVSIPETDNESITIYPNPAHEWIYFESKAESIISNIKIYDSHGKLVIESFSTDRIDIHSLHSGIYIIDVRTNTGKSIRNKIVVL